MLLSGLERGGGKIAIPVSLKADNLAAAMIPLLPAALTGFIFGKENILPGNTRSSKNGAR